MNKLTQQVIVTAAGALATGLVIYWFVKRGGDVVNSALEEVNPFSKENFVYDNVVNGLGEVFTGDPNFDFGGYLYDVTHGPEFSNTPSWSLWGSQDGKLNPVSPNNIPYRAVNKVGAITTGNNGFDLGQWWYDLINSDKATGSAMKPTNGYETPPVKLPQLSAINPVSTENVVYKGVNSVGSLITGNDKFDLGRWFYDLTN